MSIPGTARRSTVPALRLTTRQVWVLQAVADGRLEYDVLLGELAGFAVDGCPVGWTVIGLAVRGLVVFDPLRPGPPRLARRGAAVLGR
ncbi:hypothetical protein [Microlunatus ginsengisoli]|uniref:MarR family transcriptional regulator n=1 Tax=Microlunatus ginsengisoli TaxID=363863 RepID=A0ABP7A2U3_9ACTN